MLLAVGSRAYPGGMGRHGSGNAFELRDQAAPLDPRPVHRALPGYAPAALRELPSLAAAIGVRRLWVKDETSRLGLPSFKILGASFALQRALRERLGDAGEWSSWDQWVDAAASVGPMTLVTATRGRSWACGCPFGAPAQSQCSCLRSGWHGPSAA